MATSVSLTIDQGTTYTKNFTVKANGVVYDLTDWYVRGHMRETYNSTTIALNLTTYLSIPTPENGIIILAIPHAATTAVSFTGEEKEYVFDIEIYNSTQVHRIVEGTITLRREVTR